MEDDCQLGAVCDRSAVRAVFDQRGDGGGVTVGGRACGVHKLGPPLRSCDFHRDRICAPDRVRGMCPYVPWPLLHALPAIPTALYEASLSRYKAATTLLSAPPTTEPPRAAIRA